MSYTVLARRYRSRSFDDLIGQEAIAQTLRNAITHDRVAHAYLFCGTRGVGKTSTARLFAKALNATDEKGKEIPEIAEAIMKGQDTDTIEIDAASNNSVDDARDLIAKSVYRPLRGKKKVYIIDEVHMLSTAAFNALLKTMEEPPEHVVFILCTTETHKVPATIQSRCQRFEFRNIPTAEIAKHLSSVITQEGATAEAELVHQVAKLGNGSMRDALSLLDRLLAGGEKKLTVKTLEELLGLPSRVLVGRLVGAILSGDVAGALKGLDELTKTGVSPEQALGTIADRLRDVMVIAACGEATELVDLGDESRQEAAAQAQKADAALLSHMIAVCDGAARNCRSAANPRAVVDAAVVRLAMTERVADAAAVLSGRVLAGGGKALVGAGVGAGGKK